MASRSENRSRLVEYGQLFATSFIIVVCSVWVGMVAPRSVERLGAHGLEASGWAEWVVALRWFGLLLLPLFFAAVWKLKKIGAGRAPVIATSVAFAFASLGWVVLAMWAIWLPLGSQ